jgi:hypothetical protein
VRALVVLLCVALSPAAQAQQSFTLTGRNGELAPLTFTVEEGSRVIQCAGNPPSTMTRCLLFSGDHENRVREAYRAQISAFGWRPNGITTFSPPASTGACPPFVMVFPASGSHYEPDSVPAGQAFYFISYAADVMCEMDRLHSQ